MVVVIEISIWNQTTCINIYGKFWVIYPGGAFVFFWLVIVQKPPPSLSRNGSWGSPIFRLGTATSCVFRSDPTIQRSTGSKAQWIPKVIPFGSSTKLQKKHDKPLVDQNDPWWNFRHMNQIPCSSQPCPGMTDWLGRLFNVTGQLKKPRSTWLHLFRRVYLVNMEVKWRIQKQALGTDEALFFITSLPGSRPLFREGKHQGQYVEQAWGCRWCNCYGFFLCL